jgi:hypothetical protein
VRIYRFRLLLVLVLTAAACAFAPAVARADTGSITNLRDIGGGQLEATFSATGTECTSYSFCGWFAYARQVPQNEACSVSSANLVWVGGYHSDSGSETQSAAFYRSFTPTKICLIVDGANHEAVVAEATWSPPPPPPPSTLSPADGARLTTRSSVPFAAVAQDAGGLEIEIAQSPGLDPDGTLANGELVEQGTALPAGYPANQFEYESSQGWSQQPGTYYIPIRVTADADEVPDDLPEETELLMIRVALLRRG